MKRLLSLLVLWPMLAFTQVDTGARFQLVTSDELGLGDLKVQGWIVDVPGQRTFVSVSGMANSFRQPGLSFELGRWGITSPFSWSVVQDVNFDPNLKNPTYWTGLKAYFTFYEKGSFSYMLYFSPKVSWGNLEDKFLIEEGLCFNYSASNNVILSTGFSFQSGQTFNLVPGVYGGLVFLLSKK